jgi:hypothetical protein
MIHHMEHYALLPRGVRAWSLSPNTAYVLLWVVWGALLGAGIGQSFGPQVGSAAGAFFGGITFGLINRMWAGRTRR